MKEKTSEEKHLGTFGTKPKHLVHLPLPMVVAGAFASVHGGQSVLLLGGGGATLTASRNRRKEFHVRNFNAGERRHFTSDNSAFRPQDHWANAFKAIWMKVRERCPLSATYDIGISGPALERDVQTQDAVIFVGFLRLLEKILGKPFGEDLVLDMAWEASQVFPFYSARYRDLWLLVHGKLGHVYLYDEGRRMWEEARLPDLGAYGFIHTGLPFRILSEDVEAFSREASELLSRMRIPLEKCTLTELPLSLPGLSSGKNGIVRHLYRERILVPRIFRSMKEGRRLEVGRLLSQYSRSLLEDAQLGTPEVAWVLRRLMDHRGILGFSPVDGGLCGIILAVVESGVEPPYNLDGDDYYRTFWYRLGFSSPKEGDSAHTLDQ